MADRPAGFVGPLQAPPGVTAMAGQVLRLNGLPLADVLDIDGHQTRTDRTGRFLLELPGMTSGHQELVIDGATANRPGRTYGRFEAGLPVTAGRTVVLSFTIWMPRIDVAHAVTIPSPTGQETVVTTPLIPGLELHLAPNTVIRDHDGKVVRQLSITPIPVDRSPFPLPNDTQVPIYFTIQPGGAYVHVYGNGSVKGARLVYPNYTHQQPGTRMDFWHYEPDGPGWTVYGQGAVNAAGRQVVPDPGISIYEFTAAMISSGGSPPSSGPFPGGWPFGGDPVDLATGLFVNEKTDLYLPDVTQSGTAFGALAYTYDGGGRRSAVSGTYARSGLPATLTSATYDDANQIATFAGTTFTYDSNGNVTADGSKSYTWNARNELSGISGGAAASFAYDALGRRRRKTISSTTTQFLYDGLNPVQELASGTPTANLLAGLGIDELFTRTDATTTRHYLTDALGSSVALTDGSGTVQTEYTYEPFGTTTATGAGPSSSFEYTGRESDGTALLFYRARYYDPRVQRFISEDPLGFAPGDPDLYSYVRNRPIDLNDASGQCPVCLIPVVLEAPAAAVAAAAALTAATLAASPNSTLSDSIFRTSDPIIRTVLF